MRPVAETYTYTRSEGALPSELLELLERPAWWKQAACRGKPTEWWFSANWTPEAERAAEICDGCPVRAECLAWALKCEEGCIHPAGIFGGLSPSRRRRMRRESA